MGLDLFPVWLSLQVAGSATALVIVLGLPLAWSIGAVAVGLVLYQFEPSVMMMMVARVVDMSLNYTLLAVPLFVLMAGVLQRSGVAEELFNAVHVWAGGLRGGLAIGTIIANAIMASMVGIIGAEIVTFGLIALPEMLARVLGSSAERRPTLSLGRIAQSVLDPVPVEWRHEAKKRLPRFVKDWLTERWYMGASNVSAMQAFSVLPAAKTTASRGSEPLTAPTTTARLCWIRTAITWRPLSESPRTRSDPAPLLTRRGGACLIISPRTP